MSLISVRPAGNKPKTLMKCPKCDAMFPARIRRAGWERFVTKLTRFRKWYCIACNRRYWARVSG
jgi:hypothetical protein